MAPVTGNWKVYIEYKLYYSDKLVRHYIDYPRYIYGTQYILLKICTHRQAIGKVYNTNNSIVIISLNKNQSTVYIDIYSLYFFHTLDWLWK